MTTKAYGARAADVPLEPMDITRRAPGPRDVQIEIRYCGVCHSDLHTVRSEWGGTQYPCVPGHEIVGHVSAVGDQVTRFKVGETVGVGCLVGSCRECASCKAGLEQYCEVGFVGTYNGPTDDPPGHTLGGYTQRIVVDEYFVLKIRHPEEQLAAVAPLLCAGITTYSPLAPLEGRAGAEGRHRRHRRARPHGHQARACDGRARRGLHHLGKQAAGRARPGRRRSGDLARSRADEGRTRAASTSSSTPWPRATTSMPSPRMLKRDGTLCLVGVPEHAASEPERRQC